LKKDWKKDRAKAAKHARLMAKRPELRAALYGETARDRQSLALLDGLTADTPATGQRKENEHG
jgi:hypothetical protein